MRCVKVRVTGRVQGVWFRDFTRQEATKHNLVGWVRNLPDRSVEALIAGGDDEVENMIRWFSIGSPLSRVEHVDVQDLPSPAPDEFTSFQIRY